MKKRIAIIGAGIGGLTLANLLQKDSNFEFVIYEKGETLNLEEGEKPQRRDQGTHLGERVSGDHKTTTVTFMSVFSDTDILLTNTVNGKNVYDWLMELRNQVNYRERVYRA